MKSTVPFTFRSTSSPEVDVGPSRKKYFVKRPSFSPCVIKSLLLLPALTLLVIPIYFSYFTVSVKAAGSLAAWVADASFARNSLIFCIVFCTGVTISAFVYLYSSAESRQIWFDEIPCFRARKPRKLVASDAADSSQSELPTFVTSDRPISVWFDTCVSMVFLFFLNADVVASMFLCYLYHIVAWWTFLAIAVVVFVISIPLAVIMIGPSLCCPCFPSLRGPRDYDIV
jgi:hypothetical protein